MTSEKPDGWDREIEERTEQMRKNPGIRSYVADKYFISTMWRESSAMEGGWYYETIVWEWNNKTKDCGDMLFMSSGLASHFECCRKLLANQPLEDEDKND